MRVKIIHKPAGPVRFGDELVEWPEVGGVIDIPASIAEGMIATGTVEKVGGEAPAKRAETRPAPAAKRAETRKAKG